jgi:hypothetical protein
LVRASISNEDMKSMLIWIPLCSPGMKFSQVEFVAVLALLMSKHRLSIVRENTETKEQARERANSVINDCDMQLLLRMRDSDRVRLRMEPRE